MKAKEYIKKENKTNKHLETIVKKTILAKKVPEDFITLEMLIEELKKARFRELGEDMTDSEVEKEEDISGGN